ncbi:UNVERIFIED_CONTAM: hypothetical protein DES50_10513 [Williamsia faeni]
MANAGWEFWKLTRVDDDRVEWLAITRPGARAVIDQRKVWTLIPNRGVFIANWFVTQDHHGDANVWVHENIDVEEARTIVVDIEEPAASDVARLTHPEAELTLEQIDRHPAEKLLGKRVAAALDSRR